MSYLALYRKYRPKVWADVIGQEHITETLSNQIRTGKIGHAYLLTGSRGTGKTSTAKIFAKAVNCLNNLDGSPCGICDSCKALDDPSAVDILEIDAASNNRVDEIRELREKIGYTPVISKYKVYIIDEVHMLTDSAFNALLKTLEEPPAHAIFILATTEVQKLPATILSRCMRFDFKLIPVETLTAHLLKIFALEGIKCDEDAARVIAVAGEGSSRDTLSIADCVMAYAKNNITLKEVLSVIGSNERDKVIAFGDALNKKNLGEAFEIINDIYLNGKNISIFARDIAHHFRDLLIVKSCKNPNSILNFTADLFEKYKKQADEFEMNSILEYMKIFTGILTELKFAISPKILVETATAQCFDNALSFADVKKN